MKIRISGGLVIDPGQKLEAVRDVLIENGKIAAIVPPSKSPRPSEKSKDTGARTIDASGKWVIPGIIDMHVHLREPGREGDETISTGSRAAARGGVTTVLAMPNTEPVIDSPALVEFLRDKARTDSKVNLLVSGAVTKGQKGSELAEMGKMAEAGAVAMTDDGHPVMNALVMRRALEYAKSFGLPILDHCEDTHLAAGGVINEGIISTSKGLQGIPETSETTMAMRDIALAELTGGRLHLCHISCAKTVDLVRQAKRRGIRVTAETAPHYFTLTDADIPDYNADFKMNPPLRTKSDVKAIQEGLADGTIDTIATDHAPHSPAKKAQGIANAPFGIIGLETLLPLTLRLVETGVINRKTFVSLLSSQPARILGLKTKGSLKPGMDADITVVDPKDPFAVPQTFESKSRNSPFKDWKLKGTAVMVLVGGRIVVENGKLL